MKTLVVPVDFSAPSDNAADYALALAQVIEMSISLVHVYQLPVYMGEIPVPPEVVTEITNDAKKNLLHLKESMIRKAAGKTKIFSELFEGNLITQLEKFCEKRQPYAIVMGARGASNLERILFGSNALEALRTLSWPLIIVPPGITFKKIARIGLACDFVDVKESIHASTIKSMVTALGAELHVLYIKENVMKMTPKEIEESAWLREMLFGLDIHFHFLANENVEEEISKWAGKNKLDILVIVPKNHDLLDRIIHKSHSKEFVLHTHLPIISIHE